MAEYYEICRDDRRVGVFIKNYVHVDEKFVAVFCSVLQCVAECLRGIHLNQED